MYPSSVKQTRQDRVKVDSERAAFYAGTTFRAFKEITLAAGASLNIKMTRGVDLVIRKFTMHVKEGEMRCEIYRGATPSGDWSNGISISFRAVSFPILQSTQRNARWRQAELTQAALCMT